MNLGPPSSGAASRRPYQQGQLLGTRRGAAVARTVEWMVDTGADISAIHSRLGSPFDVKSVGASARPTTGGRAIQAVIGITVEFDVEDANGVAQTVQAVKRIGIKHNNAGSNVLGMEHVAEVAATVSWDPSAAQGTLLV